MRALTVLQPFASLIADGSKWIENRVWTPGKNPGTVAIHAGASRKYLKRWAGPVPEVMPYSAIIAIAEVERFVHIGRLREMINAGATVEHCAKVLSLTPADVKRIAAHDHAEGPWGWVLKDVKRLRNPVKARGAQGLWKVPTALRMAINREL